jgi:hypothetical protein
MTYVLIEVRGGIAEVDAGAGVDVLKVDWDDLGDDWAYAQDVLESLGDHPDVPLSDHLRIADLIAQIWPEEHANWLAGPGAEEN